MVGSTKPSFEVAEYAVDVRQPDGASIIAPLNWRRLSVVLFVQRFVTLQTIYLDGSSMSDVCLDEGSHSFPHKIGDALQAHAATHFSAIFHSPHHKPLAR